ncbi:MAG TPA: hypothetical protein VGN77_06120, partial [Steroidobacteraceae bacterium]|nr:hypothetical protein [Steroidobacteraceae bacterium]
NSTTAQLKREPSPLGVLPVHRLSAFGQDVMPGMLESCAEPQQRLTQLLEHLRATVEKGEETSIWPPPVLAVKYVPSASTIVPGDKTTFLSRQFESDHLSQAEQSPCAGQYQSSN